MRKSKSEINNQDNKGTGDTLNGNTTGFKNYLNCTAMVCKYNGET